MKALLALALMTAPTAYAGESFEACTDAGPCALRVTDTDTGDNVWLVTEAGYDLHYIWSGTYWMVDQETYNEVRALIPDRIMFPAKNPTTDITLERAKGTTPPKSTPPPASSSGSGGSFISVGNITVGGGAAGCTDCHTGTHKEIHKKVMDKGN